MYNRNKPNEPDYVSVMVLALFLLFATVFVMSLAGPAFAQAPENSSNIASSQNPNRPGVCASAHTTISTHKTISTQTTIAANIKDAWTIAPEEIPEETPQETPETPAPAQPSPLCTRVAHELARIAGGDPADLRITFSASDADALNRDASNFAVEVRSENPGALGVTTYKVRLDDGAGHVEHLLIRPNVERRVTAVVACMNRLRNDVINPADVAVQQTYVTRMPDKPFADVQALIGQRLARPLRAGVVVEAEDIQPVRLIERGQTVTLRVVSGSLVVSQNVQALGDGAMNDIVQARNPQTRETYAAVVSGPAELTIQLGDEGGKS